MSTILCFSVNMGCCVYINEGKKMILNDFSKWLQYNRVKNLSGSEYCPHVVLSPRIVYVLTHWHQIAIGSWDRQSVASTDRVIKCDYQPMLIDRSIPSR